MVSVDIVCAQIYEFIPGINGVWCTPETNWLVIAVHFEDCFQEFLSIILRYGALAVPLAEGTEVSAK